MSLGHCSRHEHLALGSACAATSAPARGCVSWLALPSAANCARPPDVALFLLTTPPRSHIQATNNFALDELVEVEAPPAKAKAKAKA